MAHSPLGQQPPMPGFERMIEGASVVHGYSDSPRPINVLQDGLAFMTFAAQALSHDEFSKCFVQKPRSKFSMNIWPVASFAIRYFFLFPLRLSCLLTASFLFFLALPFVLAMDREDWQRCLFKIYCKAFLLSWGSRIKYHTRKPKLDNVPHLFVSNHTTVIDYIVLSANEFPHATIAQTHGGLLGMFEHSVLTLNGSLMFNRNEKNDRKLISAKMRKHVHNTKNVPLLIFPEGTCVNNEYTVLFQKGAFELDATVVPVAIKYDKNWADAYWHSKTQSFTYHILYLMTRWGLKADVTYLPPQTLQRGQTSTDFANSVKAKISKQAKLKNLSWDGYFKNYVPTEEKQIRLKETPQSRYGALLNNRMRMGLKAYHRSGGDSKFSNNDTTANCSSNSCMKKLQRANSFCMGDMPVWQMPDRRSIEQPEWLNETATVARNAVLIQLLDHERSNEMVQKIAEKKNDVVNVWKNYTKNNTGAQQRRIENTSWRMWFKQRIEYETLKMNEKSLFDGASPVSDGFMSPTASMTPPILGPVIDSAYHIMFHVSTMIVGLGVNAGDESDHEKYSSKPLIHIE
ncbi:1-acylglycerol-3-phosphate O-acyltransferase 6 (lysophosphatidic acid acyltransferase, zeta) [Physocladia obscura]|uniref:1-acylglycerol-3-phosphate O-acyltransferase 6 (Lysophosphatidic acid acyltransferase, zeta) n=1 Tax=Physocladia obscura TaxID=109957 RepID=A0AAD5T688_9FUNG|nr:1-acylglycerol-3-phosphate O-acyltransferase 6 (lysophosphatidic acid acyltransferase, zeta) [Physocladia obscura]